MIERLDQLDPLEISLRELADAERADLFRKTRVDPRWLLRSTSGLKRTTRTVRTLRWVSIAAVFAMAVTISGWILTSNTKLTGTKTASVMGGCDGTFFGCLTGPNGTPTSGCRGYDYDADGDIDLIDAKTYQLNCTGLTR